MDLFLTISTFIFCCILHSLTATYSIKQTFQKQKISDKNYRLIYNLFSVLTFGFWYYFFILKTNQNSIYTLEGTWKSIFNALRVLGILGFLLTLRDFSGTEFLGLKEQKTTSFTTKGMFKFCRHPLYFFSTILLIFDSSPTENKLVFSVGCATYFFVGSYFEEKRMIQEIGEKYLEYKRNTPRFIPFLKLN
ncbi:MAG: isoprenylcysteine carboxylmethyltransferase family protein [Calditrichaeota bacterium]|nr:MAG: isoprenylcysteine carboxylmethyltransferase family protein [Calditrichota bacterium]